MLTPILDLIKTSQDDINQWFEEKWKGLKPPIYLSCDLRNSGFKIGVVDTNLFPAGFNNLCGAFSKKTTEAFDAYLKLYYPQANKMLIYGEEHTRNKFYLKNLSHLQHLLEKTGRDVKIGILGEYLPEPQWTVDLEGDSITLLRLDRNNDEISCGSFVPDLVLSNNDFSSGIPALFDGVQQAIIPSPQLGWFKRRKNHHFDLLKKLLDDFGKQFGIDPWQLYPCTDVVTRISLFDAASLNILAERVEIRLDCIRAKYSEYGITEAPYVYLKSNSGTYGMGILPVFSAEEVLSLNRRKKNKLLSSKGGPEVTEYLIQEGIPTVDSYSGYPLEPVIYAVGKKDIGGFFRIHESKNELESLNAPGMTFSCLCLHKLNEPHEAFFLQCQSKEGVVSLSRFLTRIACLAAAMEI